MRNVLIAVLLFPLLATAFTITNQYIIPEKQQIGDEQWILATIAQPDGIFLNDLFIVCANPLYFNGTYRGNVNGIAGMETVLRGTAERNVRITGKVVRIEGVIKGNLNILADTVTISTTATIQGTVRLIADKAILEGSIGGDLHATAGTLLSLDGAIAGNTLIKARETLIADGLRVAGDFTYRTDQILIIDSAQVGGSILKEDANPAISPFSIAQLKSRGLWLFAAFLTGALYLILFPGQAAHATHLIYSPHSVLPDRLSCFGCITDHRCFLPHLFGRPSHGLVHAGPLGCMDLFKSNNYGLPHRHAPPQIKRCRNWKTTALLRNRLATSLPDRFNT